MRNFCTRPFNDIVDLDDSNTYSHLSKNVNELRQLMYSEIGYTHCYMNVMHKKVFKKGDAQRKRIQKFVKKFVLNQDLNRQNVNWYQEQIFLFQNEIENMF